MYCHSVESVWSWVWCWAAMFSPDDADTHCAQSLLELLYADALRLRTALNQTQHLPTQAHGAGVTTAQLTPQLGVYICQFTFRKKHRPSRHTEEGWSELKVGGTRSYLGVYVFTYSFNKLFYLWCLLWVSAGLQEHHRHSPSTFTEICPFLNENMLWLISDDVNLYPDKLIFIQKILSKW